MTIRLIHSLVTKVSSSESKITSNNFKVLKSQKWDEFKQYVIALLDSLHLCAEEINVNIFMDNTIRSLLNAPAYTDNEKKL